MESVSTNASKEERERAQKVREAARSAKQLSLPSDPAPAVDQSSKACTHFVALPENFEATETLDSSTYGTLDHPSFPKDQYVKTYGFELDPFQAYSVACVERNESVMVAAHTSAGKTAIAEYAIAKALKAGQRVLYTSPLKALSNQKFRELQEEFGDVGLMTGDVSIDPESSCVVMTTEILRSMLYRGSEILREISWVIFDEIHYMQDRERGVVWEETIISLPRACRMVFLSATLSNAQEFASWVASLHEQPCHVVYTEYRPTPLEHFGLPCQGSQKAKKGGIYKICDKNGSFSTRMWDDLQAAGVLTGPAETAVEVENKSDNGGKKRKRDDPQTEPPKNDKEKPQIVAKGPRRDTKMIAERVVDMLKLAEKKALFPVIVFSFVRLECESFAMHAWTESMKTGSLDFTTDEEKAAIEQVFDNAVASLGEDAELRAVKNVKRYLLRGIGVHHGGLIPLVKELVEILFQESLVKVLFATETFAMGLNMPARAVVFTAFTKSDGECIRSLTSGEYIQMSGRAGRRGKDDRGYAIMLVEDASVFSPTVAKAMLRGAPMPLVSRFKLSYYTLLNLTKRTEGGLDHMEYLIGHSFQTFQHTRAIPGWKKRLEIVNAQLLEQEGKGVTQDQCDDYVSLRDEIGKYEKIIHSFICKPDVCIPFLTTGRIVKVREGSTDWGWGVVLQTMFRPAENTEESQESLQADAFNWQVIVVLSVNTASKRAEKPMPEPLKSKDGEAVPIPVPLPLIVCIAKDCLELPSDLRPFHERCRLRKSLSELVCDRYSESKVPELHPIKDMHGDEPGLKMAVQELERFKGKLEANTVYQTEQKNQSDQNGGSRKEGDAASIAHLALERADLQGNIAQSQLSDFKSQVKMRRKVLRKLGHLSAEGLLTSKGKAAAEIDTADELMVTELLFNAVWKTLDTPQLVALLSCMVPCKEKNAKDEDAVRLPRSLEEAVRTLQSFAVSICEVTNECGLVLDEEAYVQGFTTNLMVPFQAWASGSSFIDVTENSMIYEGTLIRCARRLMELMNQVIYAAQKVGEKDMEEQVTAALKSMQRGIMFCGSLYL